ncbi:effector-associated constant component EACC1 [Nocardia sp. CA-107356]|uniref:effector-associated constant component EACC1 n=1 Tax=Nocardia sp. CA-107356 TaxID=3239972 RepID=UPI003D8B6960
MTVELLVAVTASDDDVEELHSLYSAIIEDDDMLSAGKGVVRGEPGADTLGAEEIIRLVLDSPELWTAVSACVTAWLQIRKPNLKLKLTTRNGRTAEIDASGGKAIDEAQVRAALEIVRGALDEAP